MTCDSKINVLLINWHPQERPPLLSGQFFIVERMALQKRNYCTSHLTLNKNQSINQYFSYIFFNSTNYKQFIKKYNRGDTTGVA